MPKKEYLSVMRKLKLIWDFRGPEAQNIAKHHTVHLAEYGNHCKETIYKIDFDVYNDLYTIAYMIVDEKDMKHFRDHLKPHRGEWLNDPLL